MIFFTYMCEGIKYQFEDKERNVNIKQKETKKPQNPRTMLP